MKMEITGKCRVWFEDRGYGFMDGDFGLKVFKSVYFHAKAIRRGLPLPGASATFRVVEMPKGFAAFDVMFATPEPVAPKIAATAAEILERKDLEETLSGGNR
jgi:cold shock CspA family protein